MLEIAKNGLYAACDERTGEMRAEGFGMVFRSRAGAEPLAKARMALEIEGNSVLARVFGEGAMDGAVECPRAFQSEKGDVLLLPIGEGFAFPVDDPAVHVLPEMRPFWSTSQCMGFWGVLRGGGYMICAPENPADARIENPRGEDGLLETRLLWEPELGAWGYPRALRLLFGRGGITEAMKAYRAFRETQAHVPTLREKRARLPALDRLIGAPDVWLFCDEYEKAMYSASADDVSVENGREILRVAREMRAGGFEKALMGLFFSCDAESARELSGLGYLTAKYDNYQDVLPAEVAPLIPKNRLEMCDYTARRVRHYPDDIRVQSDGTLCPAWALRGVDGEMHAQNTLCATRAKDFVAPEVGALKRHWGLDAWFLDVLGCGLAECWSKEHPMTRGQCAKAQAEMLENLAELGLLAGTEEGVECFLPNYHYAEGRMSPQMYRINYLQSGRRKATQYAPEEREDAYRGFMLNPVYRAPLWELAYHECAVSYWYWGDSSNCCPEDMPRRDLFNALYGTPPLYSLKTRDWDRLKGDILRSRARACEVAEAVGYAEMLSFEYLSADKRLQRTRFEGGVTVTANFSDTPRVLENGRALEAMGCAVERE